jgi:glutamate synthase domain-containing protein 1
MLKSLQHRGIDSAGIAFYRKMTLEPNEYLLFLNSIDLPGTSGKISSAIAEAGGNIRDVHYRLYAGYGLDDYVVAIDGEKLKGLVEKINSTERARVLSFGKGMTIMKEVGEVELLEKIYGETFKMRDREMIVTHGIGHVRFSTESVVDKHHAHPFQAGFPDIAIVHNGQITNDGKMRERLKAKGHRFESENDTELIIHYIVDRIREGFSLEESLEQSVEELDGPFAYIISTPDAIGIATDKLGLRPLVVAESENMIAAASEESALREIMENPTVHYMPPASVKVFKP